jgi:hypothetical protein
MNTITDFELNIIMLNIVTSGQSMQAPNRNFLSGKSGREVQLREAGTTGHVLQFVVAKSNVT